MMISYAQNFEDVMLWRALKDVRNGAYIDIGACDPVADSVSLHFYNNGWRGVHVEPVPAYAEALRNARPDEQVLEHAVGKDGDEITIYAFEGTGLSTASATFAERHRKSGHKERAIKVLCVSLAAVFDSFNRKNVHWLKIDVEGMEAIVLDSWGANPARPWIVVVESTLPNLQEVNHEEWEHQLLKRDYKFVYFDGLNRYYVHDSQSFRAKAFDTPPNVFDRFAVSSHTPAGSTLADQILRLQAQIENSDRQRELLDAEVEKREKDLERLREHLDSRLSVATHEIEIREAELVRLRTMISDKAEELASLSGMTAQRDSEIARLHIAIDERTNSLNAALAAQAKGFESAITALRDRTVSEYEARLSSTQQAADLKLADAELRFTERLTAAEALSMRRQFALEAAIARGLALQSDLGILEQRLAAAETDAAHWRAEMETRQAHIEAIRASTSWRISAPLRWTGSSLRQGVTALKSMGRPALERGLISVRANPWLKRPILFVLRLVPSLDRKVAHFAQVRPPPPGPNQILREPIWNLSPDTQTTEHWEALLSPEPAMGRSGS